jgi:hypothetical protein
MQGDRRQAPAIEHGGEGVGWIVTGFEQRDGGGPNWIDCDLERHGAGDDVTAIVGLNAYIVDHLTYFLWLKGEIKRRAASALAKVPYVQHFPRLPGRTGAPERRS